MNVSFIGSGNVAWHLAPALDNTQFPVKEIYSLQEKNARQLVDRLYDARVNRSLDFSESPSRIFIIAVADDAIADVAAAIALPRNAILLHTSGSQPLSVLEASGSPRIGVFYPLQTFTKGRKVDFSEVPFFLETADADVEKAMTSMATALSRKVYRISSAQRVALHVAAVFASNFTNHMLTLAQDIVLDHKMDFEWLKPLIVETVNKALTLGPEASQTGPAKRGDVEVLDRHVSFLQTDDAVAEIYRVISQHLIDRYDV